MKKKGQTSYLILKIETSFMIKREFKKMSITRKCVYIILLLIVTPIEQILFKSCSSKVVARKEKRPYTRNILNIFYLCIKITLYIVHIQITQQETMTLVYHHQHVTSYLFFRGKRKQYTIILMNCRRNQYKNFYNRVN